MSAPPPGAVERMGDRMGERTRDRLLPKLRPYQATIAREILRRIHGHEGGSISVEIARQGGKNELSAQVELVTLLTRAMRGGTIIKCAPTDRPQARISLQRLQRRASGANLDGLVRTTGGNVVTCGRAEARFLSAEPTANVVGHTADLLLEVDEAQDVSIEKFDRDFRPMAASTAAPVVYYGTPWAPGSLLEQAKAEHLEAERGGGARRHFRYDWERVAEHVPAYGRYVQAERARLGERHPLFRTQYLLEVVGDGGRLLDATALRQLEGEHDRLRGPRSGEHYVAGLDLAGPVIDGVPTGGTRDRDWTVLTIARLGDGRPDARAVEVVEHVAWHGERAEALIDRLTDLLRRVWNVRQLAVDATGLGGPVADLLAARLPRGRLQPVVFSAERKSRLGFGLLAAAHSGRLRLYRRDGSPQWAEARRQLELARVAYRDRKTMQFYVDPADGHDDYLMSLALTVEAAAHSAGGTRTARGRGSPLRALPTSLSSTAADREVVA